MINNQKETQSISSSATFVLENLHNKLFKFPVLFEISSYEVEQNKGEVRIKDEILFRVS